MKSTFLSLFLLASGTLFAQVDYSYVYDADTFLKEGVKLYKEGKYQESIKQYLKVDQLDPEYATAQYELALSLSALEKKDSLRTHFERIYKTDLMKKLPTLYTLYGSFLSDEKNMLNRKKYSTKDLN